MCVETYGSAMQVNKLKRKINPKLKSLSTVIFSKDSKWSTGMLGLNWELTKELLWKNILLQTGKVFMERGKMHRN